MWYLLIFYSIGFQWKCSMKFRWHHWNTNKHSRRPESKMSDLLGDDLATEQFTHQQQLLVAASVARFGQVTICQFHLQHMCHPQEDWKAINTTIVPKANACRDQLDWSFGAGILQVSSKHAPFISHIYPSLPQARKEKSSSFTQSHHITFYHLQYQYYIRSKLFWSESFRT